ncbi:MAG: hypothetical protein IJX19_13060 [Clostridia bacterium]|nr:hypothetical protein [Clostridia bacterium]
MKKINWIHYYLGASVLLMLLATIIFRSELNFTVYSFFPIFLVGEMLWMAWRCEAWVDLMFQKYGKDEHGGGFYGASEDKNRLSWKKKMEELEELTFLLCLPLAFPLIFFFEDPVKMSATSTVMILSHLVFAVLLVRFMMLLSKQAKEKKQAEEAALREQKKKETMGQWK